MNDTNRLYTDLAGLWPLWGDATQEYAQYCAHVAAQIRHHAKRPVRTLLDMGCGGGKNVLNLKRDFRVTGIDLSPDMLEQARTLNPECVFVEADMRSCWLGTTFDAVLMDDAISHMCSREDFEAALRTAHAHLNPGGVTVVTPDVTTETFVQNRTTLTTGTRAGTEVVFIENVYDPDPTDDCYDAAIVYLIRDHGQPRIEIDRWTLGIFPLETWRAVLRRIGFEVHEGRYGEAGETYTVFACVRPQ